MALGRWKCTALSEKREKGGLAAQTHNLQIHGSKTRPRFHLYSVGHVYINPNPNLQLSRRADAANPGLREYRSGEAYARPQT